MKDIIFLVGPTAVGKTEISLHLAKLLNAEIISCDSMQVYKGMDIGTQKPTLLQQKKIPHYMIDIITPTRNFSVAEFRRKALSYIKQIHKKGKMPLFVGGTALYMKVLIDGLFPSPPADRRLRKKLIKQEERQGKGYLYKELCRVDPHTAKILHSNDTRRIIRALEVYVKSGIAMSELKKKTNPLSSSYNVKVFYLNRNRQELYQRIDGRVDKMFKRGLLAECNRLKSKSLSITASQALGYKELFAYLDSQNSLKDAKELIKRNTRRFAKRQLSWFRNDKRVISVDLDEQRPKYIAKVIYSRCMR